MTNAGGGDGGDGLRDQGWHPTGATAAASAKRHTKFVPFPNRLAATLMALRAYFTRTTYVFKAKLDRKEGNRPYKSLLRAVNIDHVVKNRTFQFAVYHPFEKQRGRLTPKG